MNQPGHEGLYCRKMRSKLILVEFPYCHFSSWGTQQYSKTCIRLTKQMVREKSSEFKQAQGQRDRTGGLRLLRDAECEPGCKTDNIPGM